MTPRRTVLITGCSDGGLGAALAVAFHNKGLRVFATARNLAKTKSVKEAGIETLQLDVTSAESIKACVAQVSQLTGGTLDILVNNAGRDYMMPMLDINLEEMSRLFQTNLSSIVVVSQAFFPVLRKSVHTPAIINNTSVNSVIPMPFAAAYNASKAAASMMTRTMRLELAMFGIRVIELKTGAVESNINSFDETDQNRRLPPNSPYSAARDRIEDAFRGVGVKEGDIPTAVWAESVVAQVTKQNPPNQVWKGGSAIEAWASTLLPERWMEKEFKKINGLDAVEKIVTKEL